MNRRIEVVDQLGADRGLREHHLHGRLRVTGIAPQHGNERTVAVGQLEVTPLDKGGEEVSQAGQCRIGALQVITQLSSRIRRRIARQPLRRIGEEVLVALFDGVDPISQFRLSSLGQRLLPLVRRGV